MRVRTIGYTNYATRPMEGVSMSKVKYIGDHANKPQPTGNNNKHH